MSEGAALGTGFHISPFLRLFAILIHLCFLSHTWCDWHRLKFNLTTNTKNRVCPWSFYGTGLGHLENKTFKIAILEAALFFAPHDQDKVWS